MPYRTASGLLVTPAAGVGQGRGLPGLEEARERAERMPRAVAKVLARQEYERQLRLHLGTVFVETYWLVGVNGAPTLGPARDRDGRELKWSAWAPHKGLLIDVFRRGMPPQEELEDREAFAIRHGLAWVVIAPGERLSLERLQEIVAGLEQARARAEVR